MSDKLQAIARSETGTVDMLAKAKLSEDAQMKIGAMQIAAHWAKFAQHEKSHVVITDPFKNLSKDLSKDVGHDPSTSASDAAKKLGEVNMDLGKGIGPVSRTENLTGLQKKQKHQAPRTEHPPEGAQKQ
jgi:hypothetical protein